MFRYREAGNGSQRLKGGRRRTWLALALALIPGSVGFLGIGHYYLRRLRRGFILFLIGWVLYFLGGSLYITLMAYLGLFVWQAYDAYRISRRSIAPPGTAEKESK